MGLRSCEKLRATLEGGGVIFLGFEHFPCCLTVLTAVIEAIFDVFVFMISISSWTCTRTSVLMALVSLGITLLLSLLVDDVFSNSEVAGDLILCREFALHPGVLHDLLNRRPILGLQGDHLLEKVFKVCREWVNSGVLNLSVEAPEGCIVARGDQIVVRIVWLGRSERWPLRQNRE